MTTTVAVTKDRPAILFDKLHIDTFKFTQKRTTGDPKKVISMGFCLYGRDAENNRIYDDVTIGVNDGDMETTVIAAAIAAGQTVEEFMAEYVVHKAELDAMRTAGTICDAELMAYFELAMARVAELNGKINISSVD